MKSSPENYSLFQQIDRKDMIKTRTQNNDEKLTFEKNSFKLLKYRQFENKCNLEHIPSINQYVSIINTI